MSSLKLESRSRIGNQVFYGLVILQLAISAGVLFGTRSSRSLESAAVAQRGGIVSCQSRLDEIEALLRGVQRGTVANDPRAFATTLASALQTFDQKTAIAVNGNLPATTRSLLELSGKPTVDAQWLAEYRRALSSLTDLLAEKRAAIDAARAAALIQEQKAHTARIWVERMSVATPLLLLATVLCMVWLKWEMRLQIDHRIKVEGELRRERNSLEHRIEARTGELQAEVKERMRVEQLNRGRNQILEMLARDEPTEEIFRVLVDVLARHRSVWTCAVHLCENDALQLKASADIPEKLVRNLQQLAIGSSGVPELGALSGSKPVILENLAAERKPWTELLRANGIQSVWSAPFFAPDKSAIGTLTIYTRLQDSPSAADLELLETHCQMASMILERCHLQGELRRHAYHDSLTTLPNRLLGEERLETAIRRARRTGHPVAVLWIDLDKFKQINDVHGHAAGDAVLKQVADRLAIRLRDSDTVARMGGDEFMAVLEDIPNRAEAHAVAGALHEILGPPVEFHDLRLSIAASIGVSIFPEDGDSADALERNADLAMYEAKFGNHRTRSFSPTLMQAVSDRRELEVEMAHALEHGGFDLHFQPQCDASRRVAAFEALLRFTHPTLGVVAPSRLIPVAEASQMIFPLGNWVLREACRQNRKWQLEGYPPVRIAVNISAMEFAREDFAENVARVLEETSLLPEFLELELTESVVVQDFAESTRQMERLKRLGVSIAIDDFGTGYSSLNYLHRLPIDRLKIDRSFMQVLNEPSSSLPIIEAIISMAQNMGLTVVAEGIETAEQLSLLYSKGCDLFQGYLFSRPLPADRACANFSAVNINTLETLAPV